MLNVPLALFVIPRFVTSLFMKNHFQEEFTVFFV